MNTIPKSAGMMVMIVSRNNFRSAIHSLFALILLEMMSAMEEITTLSNVVGMVEIVLNSMRNIRTVQLNIHRGLAMGSVIFLNITQLNVVLMVEIVFCSTIPIAESKI